VAHVYPITQKQINTAQVNRNFCLLIEQYLMNTCYVLSTAVGHGVSGNKTIMYTENFQSGGGSHKQIGKYNIG
jgi:hypothetical protein